MLRKGNRDVSCETKDKSSDNRPVKDCSCYISTLLSLHHG